MTTVALGRASGSWVTSTWSTAFLRPSRAVAVAATLPALGRLAKMVDSVAAVAFASTHRVVAECRVPSAERRGCGLWPLLVVRDDCGPALDTATVGTHGWFPGFHSAGSGGRTLSAGRRRPMTLDISQSNPNIGQNTQKGTPA